MKKIVYLVGMLAVALFVGEVQAAMRPLPKMRSIETTATPQLSAQELINKAEAARKEAESFDNEWVSTAELIKNAKVALEGGKEDEAKTLASKALFEGEQAVKQSQYMKKHWQELIPKP